MSIVRILHRPRGAGVSITVEHRKLGRERADGMAWKGENRIAIDPRLEPKTWIETLLHEVLHIACPYLDEEEVTRVGAVMAETAWAQGVRRVPNTEEPTT